MYRSLAFAISLASVLVRGQQVGTNTAETHPTVTWQTCTAPGSCTTKNGKIVIDSNWRWVHDKTSGKYTNCYDGNTWDATLCPDNKKCAANCALEGADYGKTYGASTSGNALKLTFITKGEHSTNIGSRMYLMESDTKYQIFSLLNKEFTFDVDLSNLPCGLNGALYFVSMDADGGMAKYPNNKGGAKYGQRRRLEGSGSRQATIPTPESVIMDPAARKWTYGKLTRSPQPTHHTPACPLAKAFVTAMRAEEPTPPTDIQALAMPTDATSTVIAWATPSIIPGVSGNSITTAFCDAQKAAFGDNYKFKTQGGLAGMGNALKAGMVLVMSIWDDHYSNMLWLDSTYPTDSTKLGAARGSCDIGSGVPADVEAKSPASSVTYSNIKFGPINSTFAAK
ncbi:related to Exoglucanase 1 [Rhynchosporium secalis]|uniref:Glucanase n=1 Tax=Rhynchosporium secalis TaxID=38038 RepID=A0A1E1M5E7_RHYSE|nr:related to Exoglucanase 1 [Rhynchosporium secalis]